MRIYWSHPPTRADVLARQQPCRQAQVEAKALADLKVDKAAMGGERRTIEADLGPVRYLATLISADNETEMVHSRGCAVARPGSCAVALGSDADTVA